jgi:hypothetical protein
MFGLAGNIMDGNYGLMNGLLGLMGRGLVEATKFGLKAGYSSLSKEEQECELDNLIKRALNGDSEAQYNFARLLIVLSQNDVFGKDEITEEELVVAVTVLLERSVKQGNKDAIEFMDSLND